MKNLSMIVVYGKNSGVATTATYFGNQWWMTAKDERGNVYVRMSSTKTPLSDAH